MEKEKVREFYLESVNRYRRMFSFERKLMFWLSLLRLIIFISIILFAVLFFRRSLLAGYISVVMGTILFGIVVKMFIDRSKRKDFYSDLVILNEKELEALNGDYSGFDPGNKYSDSSHDFSNDIDLFGQSSLFQYLNRTCTEQGSDMLAMWLSEPYELSKEFKPRKEAIQELAGQAEWRQRFIATGMGESNSAKEINNLNEWLSEEDQFRNRIFIRIISYLLPSVSIVIIVLLIFSIVHETMLLLSFVINLLAITMNLKQINRIHGMVSKQYKTLSIFSSLLNLFEKKEFESGYLKELQDGLKSEGIPAVKRVKLLSRIIQSFDNRLNMIAGILINGFLLWDYHCIFKLEKWKAEARHLLPVWIGNMAVLDGLISLSGYSFNNPRFCFPEISDGSVYMDSKDLGHPLIIDEERVTNQFIIEGTGVINIITGANMSGKSTFLRTVMVNLVLGMIAAPVCATQFLFIPTRLFSSIRTSDSLAEHESYFFAELKKLKQLKEMLETGTQIFFVLDEILKGTNSKDKSEGSWLFIEKVIRYGGTGLIATHDIQLGKLAESYPENIINRCFEIDIVGKDVLFDYKLRDGITTRMNAAILMKQHGIVD